MLLDGALRLGRQAEQLWHKPERTAECSELLGRAMDIVEELTRAVSGRARAVSKRLEEEYAFVFRQLAMAQLDHDLAPLEAALRLLAIERETWKLAVDRLRNSDAGAATPPAAPTTLLGVAGDFVPAGGSLSLRG